MILGYVFLDLWDLLDDLGGFLGCWPPILANSHVQRWMLTATACSISSGILVTGNRGEPQGNAKDSRNITTYHLPFFFRVMAEAALLIDTKNAKTDKHRRTSHWMKELRFDPPQETIMAIALNDGRTISKVSILQSESEHNHHKNPESIMLNLEDCGNDLP